MHDADRFSERDETRSLNDFHSDAEGSVGFLNDSHKRMLACKVLRIRCTEMEVNMAQEIRYVDCEYSRSDYDNPLHEDDVGVDLGILEGSRVEIFAPKDYLRPIDSEKALLKVKLVGVHEGTAAIRLPSPEVCSGRNVTYVPLDRLHSVPA